PTPHPPPPLSPYTTLFRSRSKPSTVAACLTTSWRRQTHTIAPVALRPPHIGRNSRAGREATSPASSSFTTTSTRRSGRIVCQVRSEEHTSELQSPYDLVCR